MRRLAKPKRRPIIKLTDDQAAKIAQAELGRRVPVSTIRSWKHRQLITGGPGWVEGATYPTFLDRWKINELTLR